MLIYKNNDSNYKDRNWPFVMPFYMEIMNKEMKFEKALVKIALYDLTILNHEWWGDDRYVDKLIGAPEIDFTLEIHEFELPLEAHRFILDWYKSVNEEFKIPFEFSTRADIQFRGLDKSNAISLIEKLKKSKGEKKLDKLLLHRIDDLIVFTDLNNFKIEDIVHKDKITYEI